jgi:transcriptional regulator with XRE-family HTH domain
VAALLSRQTRPRRALTQEELAEKAGVDASTVARLERKRTEPHMSTLRKLAKALDVDPTELVGE